MLILQYEKEKESQDFCGYMNRGDNHHYIKGNMTIHRKELRSEARNLIGQNNDWSKLYDSEKGLGYSSRVPLSYSRIVLPLPWLAASPAFRRRGGGHEDDGAPGLPGTPVTNCSRQEGTGMAEALVDLGGGARCGDGSTRTSMAADAVDPRRGLRSEGGRGCRRG